ncbi:MAG: hypothetical protein ABL900_19895 [Burkholderiaceae bacterium]
MSNPPIQFRPSGSIEFEQVEFVTANKPAPAAAAALDPAIDTDPLSINFGRMKEHKPESAERMLVGPTIDWLVGFPVDARPKALCERFPHVANRLARDWLRRARSRESLQTLVADARWGSTGFPAQVQNELQRVLEQLAELQPAS